MSAQLTRNSFVAFSLNKQFTGSVDKENGNRVVQHNTFNITKRDYSTTKQGLEVASKD